MHDIHESAAKRLSPAYTPNVQEVTLRLLNYCHSNNWAGYDPYDALNSKVLKALPFLNTRIPRLVFTQVLKRCPINFRPLLLVDKTQNPKALALFVMALLKLRNLGLLNEDRLLQELIARISALRSPETEHWCWGYSFPWQTRTILVPRGAPNLVCTVFVANALVDSFEALGDRTSLQIALNAGEYLATKLFFTEGDGIASFSYPLPTSKSKVHNANFLAAALLSRLYHHTGDPRFLDPALRSARYSAGRQKSDGSWSYGELPNQSWIDNFHTGYNLVALRALGHNLETSEFEPNVQRGFKFYREHFFREDRAPRYFHNQTYPIDIHCGAQAILTLLEFRDLDPTNVTLARTVYAWLIKHMWNERGCFSYRVLRTITISTSFMRWSQAWMLLALATFLETVAEEESLSESVRSPAMV